MHEASDDGSPHPKDNLDVQLDKFADRWIPHPEPDVDLCVLPAAPIIAPAVTGGNRRISFCSFIRCPSLTISFSSTSDIVLSLASVEESRL
jgi:hypothetical protein